MKSRRMLFGGLICALSIFISAAILYSCGGGGGTGKSGTVAVYATGDSALNSLVTSTSTGTSDSSLDTELTSTATGTDGSSLDTGGTSTTEDGGSDGNTIATGMTVTITRVELVNKGTGTSCDVLTEPVSLGIADLSNIMHLVGEADCPAASYNRIHIEFGRDFLLEDKEGHESSCFLTSSPGSNNRPDVLLCDGEVCSLDINGAVNILVNRKNNVALNFNLKEFAVNGFGNPETCSVTLKTTPICATQGEMQGYPESITGLVSHLSPSTQTFDLTRGHKTFTVLYSSSTSSQQPGVDDLLERAQADGLRLQVISSSIVPGDGVIVASEVFMKVEGVVSNLDSAYGTCTVTYKGGRTIDIAYSDAADIGTLKDGDRVQLTVTGYDGEQYLASRAGIGGSATDN